MSLVPLRRPRLLAASSPSTNLRILPWLVAASGILAAGPAAGRAWLGVALKESTPAPREALELPADHGAVLSDVASGGPADRAGLLAGDLVVGIDGEPVETPEDLIASIAARLPGDRVRLALLREGEEREIEVELGDPPRSRAAWRSDSRTRSGPARSSQPGETVHLGVRVSQLDSDLASAFGVEAGGGLLVLGVERASAADAAGIRSGDLLVAMDGARLSSVASLQRALWAVAPDGRWRIEGLRRGEPVAFEGSANQLRAGEPPDRRGAWSRGPRPDRRGPSMPEPAVRALTRQIERLEARVDRLERELRRLRRP